MRTGMLWFDNDRDRKFEDKLQRATTRYLTKYGQKPTVCYVHPSMMLGVSPNLAGMVIRGTNTVLPHHFWLGHEEGVERKSAA